MESEAYIRSVAASLLSCLGALSMGISFGWFVAAREHLEKLNLDRGTLAQIAALNNIGMLVGALLSPIFNRFISAHRLIPLLALASALAWLPMTVPRVPLPVALMVGRILTGFFTICLGSIVPGYIASVAPDNLKMVLLSSFAIAQNFGQILVIIVGPYLPMKLMTYIFGVAPPAIMVLAAFVFPKSEETVQMDKVMREYNTMISMSIHPILTFECKRANVLATNLLTLVRPVSTVSSPDWKRKTKISSTLEPYWEANGKYIKPNTKGITQDQYDPTQCEDRNPSLKKLLTNAFPVLFLGSCLAMSGTQPWTSYPQDLISDTSFITPLYLLLGRRLVLILSPLIMSACTATLSAYYFLDLCSDNAACFIPYVCLIIFFISVGIGIGTLTYVLIGDHLIESGRWITIPLVLFWQNVQYYILDAVVPEIVAARPWGIPSLFVFHTCVNISAALFVKFSSLK